MAGHSKWSKVKHKKAAADPKRSRLFTKLTREIMVAAKQSGGDMETNVRLRLAVQKARDSNMPTDNVHRAIKRALGEGDAQTHMEDITYEGYAPGGAAVMVQALTENRNRTASEVRATFAKAGGNLGEAGSVAWIFEHKGVITIESKPSEAEQIALEAIDLGADDFSIDDSTLEVYSKPDTFETLRKKLEDKKFNITSAELSLVPKTTLKLNEKTADQTLRLLDRLEELEDVQRVFSNADFPDEVLERYQSEAS